MISLISWVNRKEQYNKLIYSIADNAFGDDQSGKWYAENGRTVYKNIYEEPLYELIDIGQEFDSMANAYNEGTRVATGDIFVYVHQDVLIHDKQFYEKVITLFKEHPNTGFAGPIGNIVPTDHSWWTVGPRHCRGWVRQGVYDNILSFGNYTGPARQLDGLMLITNKRFVFPEQLPGIHFLDMWMCREAEKQGYQNMILDIDVLHKSGGENRSQQYKDNLTLFRNFYY
jgi:GT2 family glycosyltransferase